MPNIKSAKKRMRTSEKQRQSNKSAKSRLTSTRRKLAEAITAGDKSTGQKAFSEYCSLLDKAVKKGVIKKNASNRRKSRVCKKLATV